MNVKIDPEFKKRFVNALASGVFPQTTGQMYDPETNAYCAMGIAAMMHRLPMDEGLNYTELKTIFGDHLSYDELFTIFDKLINLNDLDRMTFPEIAKWVDENL